MCNHQQLTSGSTGQILLSPFLYQKSRQQNLLGEPGVSTLKETKMDLDDLIKKSEELGDKVCVSGGATSDQIEVLESAIGFNLPVSYKRFLKKYGCIDSAKGCISGIATENPLIMRGGNLYADTLFMRKDYSEQFTVPEYIWVLEKHEDGAYCFNTQINTKGDELAIVNYEPYLPEENLTRIIASSFEEYLDERYFASVKDWY